MKSINCSKCSELVEVTKIPEYHLDNVGLSNVWLKDIDGYSCLKCGNSSIFIPQFGRLLTTIAKAVVFKNASYTAEEINFLCDFFDLKGKELARLLGTSAKTVSLWSNAKSSVSPAYGVRLRKLFNEMLLEYLEEREEENKHFIAVLRKIIRKVHDENDIKEYMKHQAQVAAKEKIADFKSLATDVYPTFHVPESSALLELR